MTVASLMSELEGLGVEVRAHGERLRFRPARAVPAALRSALSQHKAEILAVLRPDSQPAERHGAPSQTPPAKALDAQWQQALAEADARFAARGTHPTAATREAATTIVLWLAEGWKREGVTEADARGLLQSLYRRGLVGRLGEDGRVLLSCSDPGTEGLN